MYQEIISILSDICKNCVIFLSNGKVIASTLEDQLLSKMVRILKTVINEIEVGHVFIIKNIIIYRITFDYLIFLIGNPDSSQLKIKLKDITKRYKNALENKFVEANQRKNINVNLILLSMGLAEGPTPISYIPKDFDEESISKVCLKSMLLLSVETYGAKRKMISFQPYIDLDALGIVALFQIEDENARGGAYDCALTILVDYEDRAIIYENYNAIEQGLNEIIAKIKRRYYKSNNSFDDILEDLKEKLEQITFENIPPEDIKGEMLDSIKKLAKL
ncbi:MAG: hypothetical protein ACTSQP_13940 [Promethearchaeota archaeon]